ncbi:MAG: citrate synthase [Brevundimonas sp.]|uniref:citrate synthase n=2 Tax=Brevundimonas sp. TaxID=1871086 RepID=UPI001A229137|nr:citrate synthase [Brevundimonas sp.]MBJ7318777.1 citrate synthase [Brevundimonas sp.]
MDDELYVDAAEATQMLGVSTATLYAYVSRKKLRSFPTPGSRTRRYWRSDILGLMTGVQRTRTVAPTPRESAITLLTENGTYYRGQSAIELSKTASVESVAALLWQADSADIFTDRLPRLPTSHDILFPVLGRMPAHDRALSVLPLVEHANPLAFDLSAEGFARTGADALRWLAAILVGQDRPSPAPLHSFIAASRGAPEGVADLIRRALILAADHEFDPTTHAVRSAATGVTPYSAVLVGMLAGRGQKLRVKRTETMRRLLREITLSDRPEDVVVGVFRAGDTIPAFDRYDIHDTGDPRAEALLSAFEQTFVDDKAFDRLTRAISVAVELTGMRPSFILPIMFLGQKLGLEGNEIGIGTIGRAIGWIAHAQEQQMIAGVERPRATYTGPLPV